MSRSSRFVAWTAPLLLAGACNKEAAEQDRPEVSDPGRAAETAAPSPAPEPSTAPLMVYGKRLQRGRELAREQRFEEAMAAFQEALNAHPGHRAYSELGFAAYKAGKLDISMVASRSALDAPDPRLAASAYYNLGLAQEARKQNQSARQSYARSLALRPSPAVKARLDALGGPPELWARPPCAEAPHDLESLKSCLSAKVSLRPTGEVSIVQVDRSGSSEFFLALPGDGGVQLVAPLGRELSPSPGRSRFKLETFARQQLAEREVLRLDISRESEVGGEEANSLFTERSRQAMTFFCLEGDAPRCSEPLPLSGEWHADLVVSDSPEQQTLFREIYDQSAPAHWEYALGVELHEDGQVSVRAIEGLGEYSANYQLF